MSEFIESPLFEKLVYDYLDDESYAAMQMALAQWLEAATRSLVRAVAASCAGSCPVVVGVAVRASFAT
jgi:hypothetical protein